MRNKDELKVIARGIMEGRIFSSWSIQTGPDFERGLWEDTDIPKDKIDQMEKDTQERQAHMTADTLRLIFLPLALADQATLDRIKKADAAVFFEELSKAGPRSVNGYPMFMSMAYLDSKEAKKVLVMIQKMEKVLEEV